MAAGDPVYASDIANISAGANLKNVTRLVQAVAQSGIANNTATPVTFTTEDFDYGGAHNTSTNTSRITPTRAGIYQFDGSICFPGRTDWTLLYCYIRINGSSQLAPGGRISFANGSSGTLTQCVACRAKYPMNGTTDYAELILHGSNAASGTFSTIVGGAQTSTFEAEFLRDL